MIQGLIFDLDGVLVTTEENHYLAWKRIADALKIPFDEHENENLKGVSRADSLRYLLRLGNLEVDAHKFEALLEEKNSYYLDSIAHISRDQMLPGALNLLLEARNKGLLLAVGSSSKNAKFILQKLGIKDWFRTIVDGHGVSTPKPHPEVFLNAAAGLGLPVSACLVFEDAQSGVEAAKAGGFRAIGVGNPAIQPLCDDFYSSLELFSISKYE
jgi:beta-phosphoglucomutase